MNTLHHLQPAATASRRGFVLLGTILILYFIGNTGCKDKNVQTAPPPPMVTVAPPVERSVVQYEYATGRVESPEDVQVRSRVSGYLVKIHFKPGTEVPVGAPLFEIDPDPFKADLAKADADLVRAQAEVPVSEAAEAKFEAQLVRATADFRRAEKTFATGASSREEFDKARADMLEAEALVKGSKAKIESDKAMVEADKANVRAAQLNLGYCSIKSPIAGKVGDTLVTVGNLVSGGAATPVILTTVVSVDPMFVAFDVDENTFQRLQKAEREQRVNLRTSADQIPVEMGISVHGNEYPIKGLIKFVNNQVDAMTGTIRVKAEFANPKPATGARVLAPGMFARLRMPVGKEHKAMLIPDSAILTDQGKSYALIVGPEKKAVRLDLVTGSVIDGYRVIESVRAPDDPKPRPVRPDEQFIVTGLQRVRAGMLVDPKPMTVQ